MGTIRAVNQIAPAFLYGDAIGNQMARCRELLRRWGFASQVYAIHRDQRLSDPGLDYTRYKGHSDNILICHYSIGSELTDFVRRLPDHLVLYYHNITPPEFVWDYNPGFAALLEQGRRELASLRDVPFALAASEYNREEMLAMGFDDVDVLPYFVYFDELLASANSSAGQAIADRYDDGWVNLLFVGRLVPNKRQEDLIWAYNYYHRLVNPHSRLLLVGSDANAPGYRWELEVMAETLGLQYVHLLGPVGLLDGLGGYYRSATVFLCMSEHEGFCIPLLEAMAFSTPVVAFNAAGVPYALGDAGLLVNHKCYDVIGELMHLLAQDQCLRQKVIAGQRQRLADFAPAAVARRLRTYLDDIIAQLGG
jgi:glycosyltransferase involved in cell wall biosynthesis